MVAWYYGRILPIITLKFFQIAHTGIIGSQKAADWEILNDLRRCGAKISTGFTPVSGTNINNDKIF